MRSSTAVRQTGKRLPGICPNAPLTVCYNGDITDPADLAGVEARFPAISGIMVGPGADGRPRPCAAQPAAPP